MSAGLVDTTTGEIVGDVSSPTPYQLLPRLTDEEFDALRDDIQTNGIRVPIDVDENGTVIDGHHRAWIAADLGIDCPRRVVAGLTDEQKRGHAIAANVYRRSLTRDQRREMVRRLRDLGMSVRQIAEVASVPRSTVSDDVSDSGHVVPPVVGTDGKTYQPQTLEQRRDLAQALREQGMSIAEVADSMGIAKSTAQTLLAARKTTPQAPSKSPSDTPRKVARIQELADKAWTSSQISRDLGVEEKWVRELARRNGIEIRADKVIGRTRRIDSNKVAAEIVATLDGLALPMRLVNFEDLDAAQADEWANSLTESIRALNRFVKQMKELAQ